jgi:hypothetical protein
MDTAAATLTMASDCSTAIFDRVVDPSRMPAPEGSPACTPPENGWFVNSKRMSQGESVIVVVGPESSNGSGNGQLQISRIGDSLVDNAMPISVGSNSFTFPAWGPTFSYGCNYESVVYDAVTFTFTPTVSGNYRIRTCGTTLHAIGTGTDPEFGASATNWSSNWCGSGIPGAQQTRHFSAGTTYYVCLGNPRVLWGSNPPSCSNQNVTVEYIDPCPADFNDDDVTDGVDLGILLAAWGTSARDITGDGTTDGVDLGILLAMWGPCPD